MTQSPRNIEDHRWLAFDNLSDCAQNIANYLGASGVQQNQTAVSIAHNTSSAQVLDASTGNLFIVSVAAAITSSSITNGKTGQRITAQFVQASGGSHAVSWPTAKYASGAAPTTSTTAAYVDSVDLIYDGTNWQEAARSVANH